MSAIISPCGQFRYRLERETGIASSLTVAGIMVNPSTADATVNDHTIRKWLGFSKVLGAAKFIIGNKFAYRAKDVAELRRAAYPIGAENDKHIEQILRDADLHIVAWGALAKLPPNLRGRWRAVKAIADKVGCPLYCWGTGKDGHPTHPLTLGYDTPLISWDDRSAK